VSNPLGTLRRGITRSGPVYALIQVNARCNLRCRMCRVWTLRGAAEGELPLSRYVEMADVLARCGVAVVTVAGEPLLRPDLEGIVAAFADRGLAVRMQSNGTLLDHARMQALVDAGLSGISVSLHSLDAGTMAWMMGQHDALARILAGIEAIEQVTGSDRRFLGILNMVLYRGNLREVPRLLDFARAHGFRLSVIPLHASTVREGEQQFTRDFPRGMAFRPEDAMTLREVAAQLRRRRRLGFDVLNSTRYLSLMADFVERGSLDWPCLAGTTYCFIDHNGQVAPCHELDPVGSIFEPHVAESLRRGDLGYTSRTARQGCPGCLLPCWTELSLMFSDASALLEAMEVNLVGAVKR
jgi:AdoMet-dependent heme synthase